MDKWKCQKCGACCSVAGSIIPLWDRGDGYCKYLTKDNLCSIYKDRPDICRVDKSKITDEQLIIACNGLRELRKRREFNENFKPDLEYSKG